MKLLDYLEHGMMHTSCLNMAKKVLYCDDCDVEFKVQFGMSENHYHARHCVFCGGEINIDDEDEVNEEYEEYDYE